jgi:hypothetical protein
VSLFSLIFVKLKLKLLAFCLLTLFVPQLALSDSISSHPIVFVTAPPNPSDFGTFAATFSNHVAAPNLAFRGGDLWIRYPDGALKNLTSSAGYGNAGFQGAGAIAVRDPSVHWDGMKVIFSMVIGAPTAQYQLTDHKWQLYEISGLGVSDTPIITKVSNQPTNYNNISPVYGSDDSIIFVSDHPRDLSVIHIYPQRDEYESAPINTGLWKLDKSSGQYTILDHSPSGDFNPIIDSYGRVIFTRWDHLQRDQQNIGVDFGAYNYQSETTSVKTTSNTEHFPEPRSTLDPEYVSTTNLFTLNQFFPWMMHQDGTDLETLNHIGRQEVGLYSERSFNNDPNLQEFYGQYTTGSNQNEFNIFLHIKENPTTAGLYYGTNCQEFGTHAAGQIISITGQVNLNPDQMKVAYLTHPSTAGATDSPTAEHSGLYRDPLPLSNSILIASHTSNTRQDTNIGTSSAPLSRYNFRLKLLTKTGDYYLPSTPLTAGITKSISFWNPDHMISYNGELWELMPVEVKSRPRPSLTTISLPAVEKKILEDLGVSYSELTNYLKAQNLALVVSRNVTVRDRNDRQQPTNLRVSGTKTESIPKSGTVYQIAKMQFFQGDLIRSYTKGSTTGRRVLAQPMYSLPDQINQSPSSSDKSLVSIAEDGSIAAFVPARRALTWQLVDDNHKAVVRERYWVTFQPGEVKVCTSCHGVNTADHLGNPPPTNSPLALKQLLSSWKNLPAPSPTPSKDSYQLNIKDKAQVGRSATITAQAKSSGEKLLLKAKIAGKICKENKAFKSGKTKRTLKIKYPHLTYKKIQFFLTKIKSSKSLASAAVELKHTKKITKIARHNLACNRLFTAIK